LWITRYDVQFGNLPPRAIAASPDGSAVFITGAMPGHGSPFGYTTVGYDSKTGRQLWARRFNGPGKSVDLPAGIAVSPDGRIVFVTGKSGHAFGVDDYATIAYRASTGRRLWLRRYHAPAGSAVAKALVVSPDGKTVFVTGSGGGRNTTAAFSGGKYTTIAYNAATGARRWLSHFSQANTDSNPNNMAISPDGQTLYVTGQSTDLTGHRDYLTVAYNAATGAMRWFARYNGRANRIDNAWAVVVAPDGKTVYVTGGSRGSSSDTDFATVAYNAATGEQRWVSRYNGPGNASDVAGSLAITPDGRTLIVSGPSHPPSSGLGKNLGYATIAYNAATGAPVWTQRTLGWHPDSPALDTQRLAISPDGSTVYLTGVNAVSYKFDYATVAYAASSGATQWLSLYDGPGKYKGSIENNNQAVALALSPDGRTLYVTGVTIRVKDGGFGTVAYRA
jgi:DNA-binding beta-propeller fold protein YncE